MIPNDQRGDDTMRDYEKDLDGLAYWMIPAVIAWDWQIYLLQQMILVHTLLHKGDSGNGH